MIHEISTRQAYSVQYAEHDQEEYFATPLTLKMTMDKFFQRIGQYWIDRWCIMSTDVILPRRRFERHRGISAGITGWQRVGSVRG